MASKYSKQLKLQVIRFVIDGGNTYTDAATKFKLSRNNVARFVSEYKNKTAKWVIGINTQEIKLIPIPKKEPLEDMITRLR